MSNNENKIDKENGIITILFERLFRILQYLPPQVFIGNRFNSHKKNPDFHERTDEEKKSIRFPRVRKIDFYIIAFILFEVVYTVVLLNGFTPFKIINYIMVTIIVLRIVDIVQANANATLFDVLRIKESKNYTTSVVRTIINIILNFFELIMCFGIIYTNHLGELKGATSLIDGLYFSLITQATLGFDEIHPLGFMKFIVSIQVIIGYFFSVLLIGRFIGLLPQVNSVIRKN